MIWICDKKKYGKISEQPSTSLCIQFFYKENNDNGTTVLQEWYLAVWKSLKR